MKTLTARRVAPSEQGQLRGALTGLRCLTGMPGPLVFGWIFSQCVGPTAPVSFPGASFFVASVILGVSAIVAARVTRETC